MRGFDGECESQWGVLLVMMGELLGKAELRRCARRGAEVGKMEISNRYLTLG